MSKSNGSLRSVYAPHSIGFPDASSVPSSFSMCSVKAHPSLQWLVNEMWLTEWHLPVGLTKEVIVAPDGLACLVFEENSPGLFTQRAKLVGPRTRAYRWNIGGEGRTFVAHLTPGGLSSTLGMQLDLFRDKVLPLADVFGSIADGLEKRLFADNTFAEKSTNLEKFLALHCRKYDVGSSNTAREIFDYVVSTSSCRTMTAVAERFDMEHRTLQRFFARYIGLSPKILIRIARFQEVAKVITLGEPLDWSDLALSLGYSDQAHFVRDFRKISGRTPTNTVFATA